MIIRTSRGQPRFPPSVKSDGKCYESRPTATLGWLFHLGNDMYLCYIDESGDSQAIPNNTSSVQPLLVISGIFINADNIAALTSDYIHLKRKYYPNLFSSIKHDLDVLLTEIKGSDIRADIRKHASTSKIVQHHFRFLDDIFSLLKKYDSKLVARIWVKQLGQALKDQSIYSITAQNICTRFQNFLQHKNKNGMLIADFRDPKRNSYVAHSVFTQKHKKKTNGDAYPNIREIPTFGISDNHACLQLTDIISSAIISPMATRKYCQCITSCHTHASYDQIASRYSKRLGALQFHCTTNGQTYFGITSNTKNSRFI